MENNRTTFQHIGRALENVRQAVDRGTRGYVYTAPMCVYESDLEGPIAFDIRDILIIGAITESDVLITGKTGGGKTMLANGVTRALFGPEGVYSKTALPTMNPSEFMDIDFPAIIEGRKTLKEAVAGVQVLTRPGIVLNEVNRAPGVIQALLIAFLDRELEVQGVPVAMGCPWKNRTYQFRVLTINEGEAYQIQPLDPAIRDRMTIEIPIDAFPLSHRDVDAMMSQKGSSLQATAAATTLAFSEIMQIRGFVDGIPVHPRARRFLNYLSGLSYCLRAPRGTKESIALSQEVCEGCHHTASFYNLCGNILAPSARSLIRLQQVARAFALLRAWRSGAPKGPEVRPEDIVEAGPFVLYSKLSLNPLWLRTAGDRRRQFWGDRWTAIREILKWLLRERFEPLVAPSSSVGELLHDLSQGKRLMLADWRKMNTYVKDKDPWACNPALVRQTLATAQRRLNFTFDSGKKRGLK